MLGLFPVSGQNRILLGNPSVAGARMHLASGKTLDLTSDGLSGEAVFARQVRWNSKPAGDWVGADQFMAGGHVRFTMGPLPDPYRPRQVTAMLWVAIIGSVLCPHSIPCA
jgi:putative alpha-1,2-mannosidase